MCVVTLIFKEFGHIFKIWEYRIDVIVQIF